MLEFLQIFLVFEAASFGVDERADFYSHQPGTSTQKSVRKTFFVIGKSDRNNRNLMLDRESECAILEFVQHNRLVIGDAAFRKYANAETLCQPFLGAVEYFHPAFRTFPVD